MLVYVAGKYGGDVDSNIAHARSVSRLLWEKGHAVITPHLNTAHFEIDCRAGYEDYLRGDFQMIARCDAIVMLDGWEDSNGATREKQYADQLSIPVFYESNLPELHVTEVKSPVQVKAFGEVIGKMHRTHLRKNADYSPNNIKATGETGLATRLWDKVARILNLNGWRYKLESVEMPLRDTVAVDSACLTAIQFLLRMVGIKTRVWDVEFGDVIVASNESKEDSYLDLAVYGVIGYLLMNGKWGK